MKNRLKVHKGYQPIAYIGDKLIIARYNKFFIATHDLSEISYLCSLPIPILLKIASRCSFLSRLMRLHFGAAALVDQDKSILIFFRNNLYCVDTNLGIVKKEQVPGLVGKPLHLHVMDMDPYKGHVLLGEYHPNASKKPIKIYRRHANGSWRLAYTFPDKSINHIHGFFEDNDSQKIYILTGDFGHAAAIWRANADFSGFECIASNTQLARACWMTKLDEKIYYASDSPSQNNYLCTLNENKPFEIRALFPILGSSIYNSNSFDEVAVFSTAVEPIPSKKINLGYLFSRRRGAGILTDSVHVYLGSPDKGFMIIFSAKKDFLPFGLFQFGNIRFPIGKNNNSSILHFFCTGVSNFDGSLVSLNLDSIRHPDATI